MRSEDLSGTSGTIILRPFVTAGEATLCRCLACGTTIVSSNGSSDQAAAREAHHARHVIPNQARSANGFPFPSGICMQKSRHMTVRRGVPHAVTNMRLAVGRGTSEMVERFI